VAEALRLCGKKKPVIVSQGMVAGSGGYWLSMYGDTIVAAPNTITGSIGVIGLWLYNKELKEKLGISTDHVQDGAHADMDFGFSFPLLGTLPDRNLTEAERARMTDLINETQQALIDLLKFYARHNGQALTILPMELMLSAPLLFENR
jgi:protease-4